MVKENSENTGRPLTFSRDPLGRTLPARYLGQYAPLGLSVSLQTNSPRLLQVYQDAFRRYGAPDAGSPEIRLRFLVDDTFSASPPWPAAVVRGAENLLYIALGPENTIVVDLCSRSAFGVLSPAMVEDHAVLRTSILECAVFVTATHGSGATHSYVHASAVEKGDRGFLFSGVCESGKSTLAYACGRKGFRIVSDDVVYLVSESSPLKAWGRPFRMRFLRDSIRFFPELEGRLPPVAPEKGIEIETEDFLPGQTRTWCYPSALFFLRRSSRALPHAEPIDPGVAAALLTQDLMADLPEVAERHCRAWARLAEQGAYILHYGDDLPAVVDFLEHFHSRAK
jgi:hypothetical protein